MAIRRPRDSVLDISIHGDDLEHDRIQLENNLQHTDLSFRLSSASDDEGYYHNPDSSVEYPRHNSGPAPYSDFPSFDHHRSRDHFGDEDTHSQMHAWSYRTGDDEEGINPYGGETMSTAGHHASALTLNAGLGGGRGARREPSISGAEYDPDRPLHEMIAGVGQLSMFDIDPSRSKHQGVSTVIFDPLVVDSTAELDRILESGHAPPSSLHSRSVRLHSPISSSSSSSEFESVQSRNPTRPKLTDALRRVSFSPKRPRSPQIHRSEASATHPSSPLARTNRLPDVSMDAPTPRPTKRTSPSNAYAADAPTPTAQPEVRLHPPTPSTAGSKFTRMARGITRELEAAEQGHWHQEAEGSRPASAPASSGDRNLFNDFVNYPDVSAVASVRQPTPRRASVRGTPRGKVHLPDVTGLTSAVESPAKFSADYYPYHTDDRPRDSEVRLLQTLSNVQAKLQHLEDENSISRRRVRELEMELEQCKREVVRERTRLLEREDIIVQQQRDLSMHSGRQNKGKGRARDINVYEEDLHEKYKEAVEEKKALEALISSLRTHLTRLTSELSSHSELLAELRKLRESDALALRDKSAEILQLTKEVERLAGEVEVLRGVVEEGLKERRASREVSVQHSEADTTIPCGLDSDHEDEEHLRDHSDHEREGEETEDEGEEDDKAEPFDPLSILGSSREHGTVGDKTMRTDHATVGSSNLAESTPARFVDSDELAHISAEVAERRLSRSASSFVGSQSLVPHRSPSPPPRVYTSRPAVEEVSDEEDVRHDSRAPSPQPPTPPRPSSSRPTAPTPAHASRPARRPNPAPQLEFETPFPQIRGERLERLFFSAPEHNVKTCTVCYRRRGYSRADRAVSPSWLTSRPRHQARTKDGDLSANENEDEGFVEGSDDAVPDRNHRDKGKQREVDDSPQDAAQWRQAGQKKGLPPQTVLAHVIRELEDDFTHYKSIYVELADQYKVMDAVSDVPKRNMLAQHLREVVDVLELKGDQIASLYGLLTFKDKPIFDSILGKKRPVVTGFFS